MSRGGGEIAVRRGELACVVTEVGGGLRELTHAGRPLVLGYGHAEVRPRYRGSLLAPWPNRIADGRYELDGVEHQVPLTEPDRGCALHGLVCWERFDLERVDDATVTALHRLVPQPGYPFDVTVRATYALTGEGLLTTVTAENTGEATLPWGTAPHPYLVAGDGSGRVDDWVLQAPGAQVLEVDPLRLLPTRPAVGGPRTAAVAGSELDFTSPRSVGDTQLDHAFTGLAANADGVARVTLVDGNGVGAHVTWDAVSLPWLQLHTGDLPDAEESRRAMAVEPMTCPPDAYGSGLDLVLLAPGEAHAVSWTIGPVLP